MVKKVLAVRKKSGADTSYDSRINRIIGQVGGIKKMINGKKNSAEILVQLKAARAAIKALEAEMLESYLQTCVADLVVGSPAQKAKKVTDLKKVFLRFDS